MVLATLSPAQSSEAIRLWESRVDSLTNGISVEINKLEAFDKTLGYARLGEVHWKHNNESGKAWFVRASDTATSPASDFKDVKERLMAQRELLKIVAGKDVDIAKKLVKNITETGKELGEKDEEASNDAILKAATAMVAVDAKQAFELAMGTLRSRNPGFSFSSLVFSLTLASKNSSLANEYFSNAVDVAIRRPTLGTFTNLFRASFPEGGDSFSNFATEANKRKFLTAMAGQFTIESRETLEGHSDCLTVRSFATKAREHYEIILPEKLSLVDYALSACGATFLSSEKPPDVPLIPSTVEELLEAAERSSDITKKTNYLWKAASKAIKEKRYQLAIDILLKVDNENRSKPYGMWEAILMQASAPLIVEKVKENDLEAVKGIFSRIPPENRPLLRIESAYRLNKDSYKLIIKDFLDITKKELAKANFKPPKNVEVLLSSPELYSAVINLYRNLGFDSDAIESLEESVPEINRYLAEVPADEKRQVISALPITWSKFSSFDGAFLDTYYLRIDGVLAQIKYKPVALDIQFSWLRTTIKRLTEIREMVEKKKLSEATIPPRPVRKP
jgi:hypothetical protein